MNRKQYTFTEMSRKTVINVSDGRELGHVCDMVFNNCGGVIGFVVPGKKSFFKSITSADNIFIPWNRIIKIGSDVILVELVGAGVRTSAMPEPPVVEATAYDVSETPNPQYAGVYTPDSSYEPTRYTCPTYSSQDISSAQTVYHTQDGSHTV